MSAPLHVAVVGLGIGQAHVWAYQQLPDHFRVVAVCDPDESRTTEVVERQNVPKAFADLGELLAAEAVDVVSVCTPPHLHLEQCRQILATGRHVVCEKPLVGSLADLDALERDEKVSAGRVMPIFQYRFGAGIQRLRHLVDRSVTGRAYLSTVETAWSRGADYYAAPWRGRWDTERGGVLLSHATHAHDLLSFVVGPVASVFARTTTRVNPIETEDCASAALEMNDGSLATLAATLGSHVEISRLRFCFENLTAESCLAPYSPGADPWQITARDDSAQAQIDAALADFDPGAEAYVGQFARLAESLAEGSSFPVTLADARASLALVTALYHSSETGSPVTLPLGPDHPKYRSWLPTL